jgi:hypothetical protein
MNTRLIGVRVGGSGMKGIKTIFFLRSPPHFQHFYFAHIFKNMIKTTTNFLVKHFAFLWCNLG